MVETTLPPLVHVALPGVRLAYRDTGGAGVPLVLLHANTGTSASWVSQYGPFAAAGFRVIAFDRRGWGDSLPDAATGPQPGSIAEDLAALVQHLALPRFHLLGIAGGGFAALDYAAWRPETLRSLIVAASSGAFVDPEMEEMVRNISVPTVEAFRALPEVLREIGPSFRALHPDRVAAWAHEQERARQPGAPAQPMRTPNTLPKIATIRLPMLAITAGADLLAPPALMRRWLRETPQAEVVDIPEVGHSVTMEAPEAFNEAVLGFLGRQ
jgi:pimeloyl-ACP methyl ester carboxylesterase